MGRHHPESPDRLRAVLCGIGGPRFAGLQRREAPQATVEQIARVHPVEFVERLLSAVPAEGQHQIDGDTALNPASGEAALRAAGALCAAVDAVAGGAISNAFCAVRPPGHHAEPSQAMGCCLFNNVAIGAMQARHVHGFQRIAIFDFDVHHGNGTQAAFWNDQDVLFVSTHQSPLYPGTGDADETGSSDNILNIPLAPGSGSNAFRSAVSDLVLPALDAFKPDFIFISAGFDAHSADPLASLELESEDFAWATAEVAKIAQRHCAGRLVSTLEGGYDLMALAACASAHVGALMEAAEALDRR